MSTSFESFLPEVLPHAPGVPEVLAINAIRNASIEFCEKALVWEEDLDPISGVADQAEYDMDLAAPDETYPHMPVYVEYDDTPITPITTAEMDASIANWRNADSGTPYRYLVPKAGTIRLYPPPDANLADALEIRAAMKPLRSASTIADLVYQEWLEAISFGALAKILVHPQKKWTNPELAVFYENLFQGEIVKAKSRNHHGNVRKPQRVRPAFFC